VKVPYQAVPAGFEVNFRISTLPEAAVIVGGVPPGQFTVGKDEVNDPVPVAKISVKLLPNDGIGIVNVQFPVRVAYRTVPFTKLMV